MALVILTNCETKDEIITISENDVIGDPGKIHNEIVIDFFNNVESFQSAAGRSTSVITRADVVDYLNEKYLVDLENSEDFLFSNLNASNNPTARIAGDAFDPFEYLASRESELSEYMYSKLHRLLTYTKDLESNPQYVAKIIEDFQLGVQEDALLTDEERNDFLVVLDVYKSSLDLWTYIEVLGNENPSARVLGDCRANAWQIPTADFIQGIAGGIFGGPGGALVGLAAGSIMQAISVCGSSSSANCVTFQCHLNFVDIQSLTGFGPVFYGGFSVNDFYRLGL